MRSYRTNREAGFALIEVVLCVALLAIGVALAVGAVAAVARGNATATRRAVALTTARNILARARAVAAFYPDANLARLTDRTAWALRAASSFSTTAAIPQPGSLQTTVPLTVTTTFTNGTAPDYSGSFTVNVAYPTSPEQNAAMQTITLTERLVPSSYRQGTIIPQTADEPRRLAN